MLRKNQIVLFGLGAGAMAILGALTFPGFHAPLRVNAQDQSAKQSPDDELLRPLELIAKSYNTRDSKGFASAWTEKAEYLDQDTGERFEGRKAILEGFADAFAEGAKVRLEIEVVKVRQLGDGAAAIEGKSRLLKPKMQTARTTFLALVVRQDGKWLIDNVRESRLPSDNPNAEMLASLAWLNGVWKYKAGDSEVTMECTEVANGNFRSHRFQVKTKGEIAFEGTQIIGWDASKQHLRTWMFSSDGSFGEGVLSNKDDRWTVRVVGTLPSGEKSSATQTLTRKSDTILTFESTERSVATRALPNVSEITLVKTTGPAKKGN